MSRQIPVYVGQLVRLTATFTSPAATPPQPIDPTTISATLRAPHSTAQTYSYGADEEWSRSAQGVYTLEVIATKAGEWWWRIAGTGSCQAASEGNFYVQPSYASQP